MESCAVEGCLVECLVSWGEVPSGASCVSRGGVEAPHRGRASLERAHLDRQASRRRYARSSAGGASSTGAGPRRSQRCGDASGCFAAGGLLLAAMAKNSSRRTPRAYALARCEAHAPRRGGRMRNDAARDAFRGPEIKLLDAMRDLVVSPELWACPRWSQVWCGRENSSAVHGGNRCESTGVCRRGFVSRILTHTLTLLDTLPPS